MNYKEVLLRKIIHCQKFSRDQSLKTCFPGKNFDVTVQKIWRKTSNFDVKILSFF